MHPENTKDTKENRDRINIVIVEDAAYEPTLHLSYRGATPVNPELWVNAAVAGDPQALKKCLEWANARWQNPLEDGREPNAA